MKEVAPDLYIGTTGEARHILSQGEEWCLVNVAKTLHLELHGWRTQPDHFSPYYVIHEELRWISVNWVDAPRADLYNYQNNGVRVIRQVLAFIEKCHVEKKKVLVSCDQGQSRSPSIAMLYMAKVLHTIPNTSFTRAMEAFAKIYPDYRPGLGIGTFLADKWIII